MSKFLKVENTEEERLGLKKEEARALLDELDRQQAGVVKKIGQLHVDYTQKGLPEEFNRLMKSLRDISDQRNAIRDWYSVSIFESMDENAKRLGQVTVVLTVLTAILAVLTADLIWRFL